MTTQQVNSYNTLMKYDFKKYTPAFTRVFKKGELQTIQKKFFVNIKEIEDIAKFIDITGVDPLELFAAMTQDEGHATEDFYRKILSTFIGQCLLGDCVQIHYNKDDIQKILTAIEPQDAIYLKKFNLKPSVQEYVGKFLLLLAEGHKVGATFTKVTRMDQLLEGKLTMMIGDVVTGTYKKHANFSRRFTVGSVVGCSSRYPAVNNIRVNLQYAIVYSINNADVSEENRDWYKLAMASA